MQKLYFLSLVSLLISPMIFCDDVVMVSIPAASYNMGTDEFVMTGYGGEARLDGNDGRKWFPCKSHAVRLSSFNMAKYPVTIGDFEKFVRETRYSFAWYRLYQQKEDYFAYASRRNILPSVAMNHVSCLDMLAYCQWLSDKTSSVFRLPTSAEWEYAAKGNTNNKYPWGNKQFAVTDISGEKIEDSMLSVYEIPEDVSPFGVVGMYGHSECVLDGYVYYDFDNYAISFGNNNPAFLFSRDQDSVISIRLGQSYYYEDPLGLYIDNGGDFDYGKDVNFRIVQDIGTVFNDGTRYACIWYQNRGFVEHARVFSKPIVEKNEAALLDKSEVYILFKSTQGKTVWYKIYFAADKVLDVGGENIKYKTYQSAWIKDEDVRITNKKWYEND
jgi:hypothetical protein